MESKEIDDKDTDGHGNITWCRCLGYRCLACCKFFENGQFVNDYDECGHYICHGCDMPVDDDFYYYVGSDEDRHICFRCIMIKNMEEDDDSISCVESGSESESESD